MDTLNNTKKTSPEDWHRAVIVARLRMAGWSLRKLSQHYKLHPGCLANALNVPYPNGERLIAAAIGVKPWEIWPSRYDADGQPNRGRKMRGFKQFNANAPECNVNVNGGE